MVIKVKEMTGLKFGKWTVLSRADKPINNKRNDAYWLCECECGTKRIVIGKDLRNGKSTNCGCQRIAVNKLELQGKEFGDLVVVEEAGFKIYKNDIKRFFGNVNVNVEEKL